MALDEAANTNATLPTIVTLDNMAPTAEILAPDEGQIIGGPCSISFRHYDANLKNATLRIAAVVYNVTDVTEFTLDTTELIDGNCTITLTVIDNAGNVVDETGTITVDNTDPEVSMINSADLNGAELTGIVVIELNVSD